MRILLRILSGVVAFLIGVGTVVGVESAIGAMEVGQVSVVDGEFKLDRDKWTAEKILSRKVDFHVNGVGIDSPEDKIHRNLGSAIRVDADAVEYEGGLIRFKDYYFEGLMVGTTRNGLGDYRVDMMELTSGSWRFGRIGIGSKVSEVKQAFGEPFRFHVNTLYYNMRQNGASLDIELSNGVVVKITVGYGRC
jgi:hypothetical protein